MIIIQSITIILIIFALGEWIAKISNSRVPSIFVVGILFMIGYWSVLPNTLLEDVGFFSNIIEISMFLVITHMGTLMDINQIKKQWKTVLISLSSLVGVLLVFFTIGRVFLSDAEIYTSIPPLTGGVFSALIMQEAALTKASHSLAIMAVSIFLLQGVIAFPLTNFLLRKETKKILTECSMSEQECIAYIEPKTRLDLKPLRIRVQSTFMILFRLCLVASLGYLLTWLLNHLMNQTPVLPYGICLILGVVFTDLGYLPSNSLEKAKSFGWLMMILMTSVFARISTVPFSVFLELLPKVIVVFALGIPSLLLFSYLCGKLLKEDSWMSMVIGLCALYGFPPSYSLSKEAIESATNEPTFRLYLRHHIMPKMLISGAVSVVFVSVILASLFSRYL